MEKFKVLISKGTIPLIILFCIWNSSNIHWGKDHWKRIIISDGKGYYAYLPATFIYHDLNIGFFDTIEKTYYDEHTKYDFRNSGYGKAIDKYFCGVAILQAPFFLAGHLAAKITGNPTDGYSKPYAIALNMGAIFWLFIGLIYLRRLLRSFGATAFSSAMILLVFVLGTNLFYYTTAEPAMSHVYSFALFNIFLVYSKKWMETFRNKYLLLSFLVLGFIVVVRPANLLILLWIPFAAGSLKNFLNVCKNFFSKPFFLLLSILLFIFPISFQLLAYHNATGHFFIDAYGIERFYFNKPEMLNFLFSYKKGLFIYTPITFLSLFGFIALFKHNRFQAIWLFISLFLIVYILSCWWMWFYGGSFGMRVMIEYFGLFAILFYYLTSTIQFKNIRKAIIALTVILVIFCQFQTLQYRYEVIHWSEMNKEKYWDAFMNIDFLLKKFK